MFNQTIHSWQRHVKQDWPLSNELECLEILLYVSDTVRMQNICFLFFFFFLHKVTLRERKERNKKKMRHLNKISPEQTDLFELLYKASFPDRLSLLPNFVLVGIKTVCHRCKLSLHLGSWQLWGRLWESVFYVLLFPYSFFPKIFAFSLPGACSTILPKMH